MIRLYEILENSNNDALKNVGFENSNNQKIEVSSIEKISIFTTSKAIKALNIYSIVTTEKYINEYGRINDVFHSGEICVLCYKDKDNSSDVDDIRNDYKFTIASIQDENGFIKLNVTSKSVLEKTKNCYIQVNSDVISSQYINQMFPKDIILTEVAEGSVTIKFTSTVSEYEGFIVAYRKADDENIKWNFIETDKEECVIENIEETVYKVRVMYFKDNEYSLFSPEVEMKFYL